MKKILRMDKFLCESLGISRKEAKELLKKKKVTINGMLCTKPESKVSIQIDHVCMDGSPLCFEEFHYLMLSKPAGVISATKDSKDRTVLDLINEPFKDKLFPVGRLDKDTEGLLLLTDDGELAHNLLSPRKHVEKVYMAKVLGTVGKEAIMAFQKGVPIGNGEIAKPAKLEILKAGEEESEILITITEGKFHQVKRMVHAIGSEVLYLKRLSMGNLVLDEALSKGSYRTLTKDEIIKLKERSC